MIVEKIPPLKCNKCGSTHVIMTSDGPECEDCDKTTQSFVELTKEVEFLLYQFNNEELEEDETF